MLFWNTGNNAIALQSISDLQGRLSTAVAAIPVGTGGAVGGGSPSIRNTPQGELFIAAPGNNIQMQSACGTINPCDLLQAIQGLAGSQ